MASLPTESPADAQDHACFEAFLVPGYVAADHPQQSLKRKQLDDDDDDDDDNVTHRSVKKIRQRSASTRDGIIAKYEQALRASWIHEPTVLQPWWFQPGVEMKLSCKRIDPGNLPIGFTRSGQDKYQYNFTDPEASSSHGKRFRPTAYRIPFLLHSEFYNQMLTVSHLCHNHWCYNWDHHILELLEINKARNGCPAGPGCRHKVKCLRPGTFSEC
jgi:hypothetical protein